MLQNVSMDAILLFLIVDTRCGLSAVHLLKPVQCLCKVHHIVALSFHPGIVNHNFMRCKDSET